MTRLDLAGGHRNNSNKWRPEFCHLHRTFSVAVYETVPSGLPKIRHLTTVPLSLVETGPGSIPRTVLCLLSDPSCRDDPGHLYVMA